MCCILEMLVLDWLRVVEITARGHARSSTMSPFHRQIIIFTPLKFQHALWHEKTIVRKITVSRASENLSVLGLIS